MRRQGRGNLYAPGAEGEKRPAAPAVAGPESGPVAGGWVAAAGAGRGGSCPSPTSGRATGCAAAARTAVRAPVRTGGRPAGVAGPWVRSVAARRARVRRGSGGRRGGPRAESGGQRADLVEDLDRFVVGAGLRQQLDSGGQRLARARGRPEPGLRDPAAAGLPRTCHSGSGMPCGAPGVPCDAKCSTRALASGFCALQQIQRDQADGEQVGGEVRARRPSSARARSNPAFRPRSWSRSAAARPCAWRCRSRRAADAAGRCRWPPAGCWRA